uniref:Uncharacterized protein n=1 Tax=Caenorhabditis japonica TaxID=281687 RepID=A0A8R1DJL7_CAEJA
MNSEWVLSTFLFFYFPLYCLLCISVQMFLFFAIYARTPPALRNMKYFFYPSNLLNFIHIVILSLMQLR